MTLKVFDNYLLTYSVSNALIRGKCVGPGGIRGVRCFVHRNNRFTVSANEDIATVDMIASTLGEVSPSIISGKYVVCSCRGRGVLYRRILPGSSCLVIGSILSLNLSMNVRIRANGQVFALERAPGASVRRVCRSLRAAVVSFRRTYGCR